LPVLAVLARLCGRLVLAIHTSEAAQLPGGEANTHHWHRLRDPRAATRTTPHVALRSSKLLNRPSQITNGGCDPIKIAPQHVCCAVRSVGTAEGLTAFRLAGTPPIADRNLRRSVVGACSARGNACFPAAVPAAFQPCDGNQIWSALGSLTDRRGVAVIHEAPNKLSIRSTKSSARRCV